MLSPSQAASKKPLTLEYPTPRERHAVFTTSYLFTALGTYSNVLVRVHWYHFNDYNSDCCE